jgi:hypothetical protein
MDHVGGTTAHPNTTLSCTSKRVRASTKEHGVGQFEESFPHRDRADKETVIARWLLFKRETNTTSKESQQLWVEVGSTEAVAEVCNELLNSRGPNKEQGHNKFANPPRVTRGRHIADSGAEDQEDVSN